MNFVAFRTSYELITGFEPALFTNNLRSAEVKTTLPPNVKWERATVPANASISFTESSGEVKWNIGSIEAGKGVLSPAATVSFRISVTPSEVDIGKAISLTNQATFTAEDTFTNNRIELMLPEYTTQIPDDPVIKEGGRVLPK